MKTLFWGGLATALTYLFTSQAKQEIDTATPNAAPKPTGNFKQVFVALIWDAVNHQAQLNGWNRDAIIAQAAEESNWGRSKLAASYNNLFGFKASPMWTSQGKPVVSMPTTEFINGKLTNTTADFRVYGSWEESIADLIRLLSTSPRYASVLAEAKNLGAGGGSLTAYFKALKDSGYNTDKGYDAKLEAAYGATRPYLVA